MSDLPLPTPRDPKLKGKRIPVKPGGIFEIPAPDGRLGYGAIIVGGGVPYVIILRSLHESTPAISALESEDIALVGWTMDGLIYHGRWPIVGGGYPSRSDIPFPNFKVLRAGKFHTTDFTGKKILGPSTPAEVALLDNQFSMSPMIYQSALMALHGIEPWEAHYDKLLPAHARARMTRHC